LYLGLKVSFSNVASAYNYRAKRTLFMETRANAVIKMFSFYKTALELEIE